MRKFKETIILWAAVCCVRLLTLIGKIYSVRIGFLQYDKAHLLVNTELWLRTEQTKAQGLQLFLSGTQVFNRQVLTMIKRKLTVWESDFAFKLFRAFYRRTPHSNVWITLEESGAFLWKEWNSAPPQMALNEEELRGGKETLTKMGVSAHEPIVCFYCRDDKYLNTKFAQRSWDYHQYRNTHVENYLKAMEWLTTQGYWALRMGALVESPLTPTAPRIIDYASRFRTEFMDVFLFYTCRFVVGDTAGTMAFATTFNKPFVLVNSVPMSYVARGPNALTIPKKYREKQTGRILTLREIFHHGMDLWLRTQQYEEAGIEMVENTPEEIADVVLEMHLRLEGRWEQTPEDEELQQRFRASIPEGHPLKGFVSRIGALFLRKNQALLDDCLRTV